MRWLCLTVSFFLASTGTSLAAERTFSLLDLPLNQPPPGFHSFVVGAGGPGDWRIVEEQVDSLIPNLSGQAQRRNIQRVIGQLSRDTTDERFPILAYTNEIYGDFTLSARIRMTEGEKEQMAGLVFRMQDEQNFYYVRASAKGGTLNFFKVVNGLRSAPIGRVLQIPRGVWHTLAVECKGNHIRVLWNDQEGIPKMTDQTFVTGKFGLWTKSDSVSHFTDIKIDYVPLEILAQSLIREAMERYDRVEKLIVFTQPPNGGELKAMAASDPADIGKPAADVEKDVLKRSKVYHSKITKTVTMTLPLHDSNGETIAAVRIVMKSFPGETEKTAITRAVPVIKLMEKRVRTQSDLVN